ncbi:Uncharacterised protein at_DN2413 [Pycnogonum litorale]
MNDKNILGTHAMLLAAKSHIFSVFSALMYSHICDLYKKYSVNLYPIVLNFFKAGWEDMERYGNCFPDILKEVIPTCIASILRDRESELETPLVSEQDKTRQQLNSKLLDFCSSTVTSDEEIHIRMEISGLVKSMIFPVINMEKTVQSFIKDITDCHPVNEDSAEFIRRSFIYEFSKEYFKKNNKWPCMVVNGEVLEDILNSIRNDEWGEGWGPDDFKNISFGKTFVYNMFVDPSDLLRDTAVSRGRSHWTDEFDRMVYRTNYGEFPKTPSTTNERRVLNQFLFHPNVNVSSIIELGGLPFEDQISVGMVKEK